GGRDEQCSAKQGGAGGSPAPGGAAPPPAIGARAARTARTGLCDVAHEAAVADGDGRVGAREGATHGAPTGAARATGVAIAAGATLSDVLHEGAVVDGRGREYYHRESAALGKAAGAARAAVTSRSPRASARLVPPKRVVAHLERGKSRRGTAADGLGAEDGAGTAGTALGQVVDKGRAAYGRRVESHGKPASGT